MQLKDNYKLKRSVKKFWMIIQRLWSNWTFRFALYLIQREIIWKLYNFKRLSFANTGQYLNKLNGFWMLTHHMSYVRKNLLYSDKKITLTAIFIVFRSITITLSVRCELARHSMCLWVGVIIIIVSLFQEDIIFGTNASLTYGPRLQK